MPPSPASIHAILHPLPDDGSSLQRLAHRICPASLTIIPPSPLWPPRFLSTRNWILSALSPSVALECHHTGSTSIPDLPAKDIIDIDLVVSNIHDEESYVPHLEAVGFVFLFREPSWYEHRFFVDEGLLPGHFAINLHVWGEGCAEVERHRIFREWVANHEEERELYAKVKRECAEQAERGGEGMVGYTERKGGCVREILGRAYRGLGYVE